MFVLLILKTASLVDGQVRASAALERLQAACESVLPTSGAITDAGDVDQLLPVQRLLLPIAAVLEELRNP